MSYGLLSALSWGISTLLAAVAARRIGALRTVVIGEVAGLAGYLTLFLAGHFSLRGVGGSAWLLFLAGCPVTRKSARCQLIRPVCWFCQ